MPHFILEHTNNIVEVINSRELFGKLHEILSASDSFHLADMKSRVVTYDDYYVGDGKNENAFVHLTLSILTGRSLELRQHMGQKLLQTLEEYFTQSRAKLNCKITVEIHEINRDTHFAPS